MVNRTARTQLRAVEASLRTCPGCLADAGARLRGIVLRCDACGQRRSWVDAVPFAPARQPVDVAAQVALGAAWAALVGFPVAGLLLALALQSLFPRGWSGWGLGAAFAVVGFTVGIALLHEESELRRVRVSRSRGARRRAVLALAARRGGVLEVADVATGLGVPWELAERLLDDIAAHSDARVQLDFDDEGRPWFVFPDLVASGAMRTRFEPG